MTNATKAARAEAIARDAIAAAEQAGYRVEIHQQQGNCWDVRLYSTAAGYVKRGYNRRRDLAKADIGDAITKMLAEVTGEATGDELVAAITRQQTIIETARLIATAFGQQPPQSGDYGFEEWACQALREQGETYRIIRGVKVPLTP